MGKPAIFIAVLLVPALVINLIGCGGGDATPIPTGAVTPSPSVTAKPITLKLVCSAPMDNPTTRAYYHFADLVEFHIDGRVTIDVYPGSQLFPATEEFEAVVGGTVDIFADATYYFSQYVPDVMVFYIDGMWVSYEQACAALEDSELPSIFAQKIEEAAPVKMLSLLPTGVTLCFLNRVHETKSLLDLEGLRLQSSPGAPPMPVYDYTGAVGIPIAFEEAAAAFVQGVIDALQLPPAVIAAMGMHEIGKHVLYYTGMFPTHAIIINTDSWDSLPTDIQDTILNEVLPEVYEFVKEDGRESEEAAIELINRNVEIVNWVAQEELHDYQKYSRAHPVTKVQMLMVDPQIVEIIEDLKPSK